MTRFIVAHGNMDHDVMCYPAIIPTQGDTMTGNAYVTVLDTDGTFTEYWLEGGPYTRPALNRFLSHWTITSIVHRTDHV